MVSRRLVLGGGLGGAAAAAAFPALAVPPGVGTGPAYVFKAGEPVQTIDELYEIATTVTGTEAAFVDEIDLALRIRAEMPPYRTPLEVAAYYLALGQGDFQEDFGIDAAKYAREWPVRANPLIVSFFDATTYRKPAGDTTAWCAAFINSCLETAVANGGSRDWASNKSAASSEFRRWGRPLAAGERPQPGDLAVYVNTADTSTGHVAFFVQTSATGLYVLGGNQRPADKSNNGEINIKHAVSASPKQPLHSIRTMRPL